MYQSELCYSHHSEIVLVHSDMVSYWRSAFLEFAFNILIYEPSINLSPPRFSNWNIHLSLLLKHVVFFSKKKRSTCEGNSFSSASMFRSKNADPRLVIAWVAKHVKYVVLHCFLVVWGTAPRWLASLARGI